MSFEPIISKHPSEREAIVRLERLLHQPASQRAEYTLNSLSEIVRPRNREELASVLGDLVRQGELKQVIRVVSPTTQGGIKDFESFDEVPRVIHDWRTDTEIEVRPDNLRVVYVVHAHAA